MKRIILAVAVIFYFGTANAQSSPKTNQKKDTYALVVSFISKGSGIDHKAQAKIDSLVQNFPKKPAFELCRMGREGETFYLFKLSELAKHEQKKFIKEVKAQISDKEMVHVEENKLFESNCRN